MSLLLFFAPRRLHTCILLHRTHFIPRSPLQAVDYVSSLATDIDSFKALLSAECDAARLALRTCGRSSSTSSLSRSHSGAAIVDDDDDDDDDNDADIIDIDDGSGSDSNGGDKGESGESWDENELLAEEATFARSTRAAASLSDGGGNGGSVDGGAGGDLSTSGDEAQRRSIVVINRSSDSRASRRSSAHSVHWGTA